jgi:hypothetical protein
MPSYHPQKLIVSKGYLKDCLKFFAPKEELVLELIFDEPLSKEEIEAIESLPIKKLEVCSNELNIDLLE